MFFVKDLFQMFAYFIARALMQIKANYLVVHL